MFSPLYWSKTCNRNRLFLFVITIGFHESQHGNCQVIFLGGCQTSFKIENKQKKKKSLVTFCAKEAGERSKNDHMKEVHRRNSKHLSCRGKNNRYSK